MTDDRNGERPRKVRWLVLVDSRLFDIAHGTQMPHGTS
jgi:hypothetical protein